jgi:hypothetical protein
VVWMEITEEGRKVHRRIETLIRGRTHDAPRGPGPYQLPIPQCEIWLPHLFRPHRTSEPVRRSNPDRRWPFHPGQALGAPHPVPPSVI